jgi:hypothetical protein
MAADARRLGGLAWSSVRHPALTLDLLIAEPLDDTNDGVEDESDDETISMALDPAAWLAARRRRGALMFAANLVFDRNILDDLAVSNEDRERLGVD